MTSIVAVRTDPRSPITTPAIAVRAIENVAIVQFAAGNFRAIPVDCIERATPADIREFQAMSRIGR